MKLFPRMNPIGPGVIGCVLILLALLHEGGAEDGSPRPAPANTQGFLTYLQPYRSIEMSPAEGGIIREILVEEGDAVTAGQALVKLDSDVTEARLEVARSQAANEGRVQAARSEYDLEQQRFEELKKLDTRGLSNNFELQRQEATMKIAEGRLIEAREQQKVYELQSRQIEAELERRILRSPIDGLVAEITKDVAETVRTLDSGRDDFLVRVVRVDLLRAVAHLPETLASGLSVGQELRVALHHQEIQTGPSAPSAPSDTTGTVEFISPIIDPSSGTVRVRLEIDNRDGLIRAGTPARLLLPADG